MGDRTRCPGGTIAAFEALKRTPEFFRRYLSRYLAYADLGSRAALLDTEAHVFNESLRRLQDADLVLRMDYGDYRVQDDALAEWLRNKEFED
jgi:hypothetical protein